MVLGYEHSQHCSGVRIGVRNYIKGER
jgi:hypothetical protein